MLQAARNGAIAVLSSVAAVLTGMAALLADLARDGSHLLAAPAGLPALAVTVLAGALLATALAACLAGAALLSRAGTAAPVLRSLLTLRRKSWRVAQVRQRDPDAAGRPRPRAPGAAPAAARS